MKICFLGIEGGQPDEGMKNFSNQIYQHVNQKEDAYLADFGEIYRPMTVQRIRNYNPDIIHLMVGPTIKGLAILKILGRICDARTIATALHPQFFSTTEALLSLFAPDLTLVQSNKVGDFLNSYGLNTRFIPSGVDTEAFKPLSPNERRSLRPDLNLPIGERVFLHVGHLKEDRNLQSLIHLEKYGHVCIIGSSSTKTDASLVRKLRESGVQVIDRYIDSIQMYYQTADVYVFPTVDEAHSIQIPLSVLEAMACNRPVLTTPFGGLPDLFDTGNGLKFHSDFTDVSETDLQFPETVRTRRMVEGYDWASIAEMVLEEYDNL